MDKIILYKNDDGKIVQATDFEVVSRKELVEQLDEARAAVRKLQTAVERYDALNKAQRGTDSEEPTTLHGIETGDGHVTFTKQPII